MLQDSIERIRNAFVAVRSSLWLIPAMLSIAAVLAARLIVAFEREGLLGRVDAWWFFSSDAETARELLSTLLSAMINMTSLVISVTMVVLTLAASQLGPRLIWSFLRDRQIQAVLGTFFATIFFILVVVRSVSESDPPRVAVTVASGLVGLCLFALLFHIHKVSRSIIADTVLDEVAGELREALEGLPSATEQDPRELAPPVFPSVQAISASRSGFIQVIEYDALARFAEENDLFVRLRRRAGHFVLAGEPLAEVHHRGALPEKTLDVFRSALVIGRQRTPTQDLEYSVRQLVEIGVRALSPGISDPFTAIAVVQKLGGEIARMFGRQLRPRWHLDDKGAPRLVADESTQSGIVDAAFHQIRQHATARGDVSVLISMAKVLGQLGTIAPAGEPARAITHQLGILQRSGAKAISDEADRADFEQACKVAAGKIPVQTHLVARNAEV
jgi:uncharacterized membrane protein